MDTRWHILRTRRGTDREEITRPAIQIQNPDAHDLRRISLARTGSTSCVWSRLDVVTGNRGAVIVAIVIAAKNTG